MGVKLIMIGVLALAMMIPALFVDRLVEERTQRAREVSESVGSALGGPQTFMGPVLLMPYTVLDATGKERSDDGFYVVFPDRASAEVATKSEERHRSIFKVPAYAATIGFKASFRIEGRSRDLPPGTEPDWSRAEIVTGASDARGALMDIELTGGGQTESMGLSQLEDTLTLKVPKQADLKLQVFGVRAGPAVQPGARFTVTARMKFSGAQRLSIVPYGKTTTITMRGDWPHPSFDGGLLPASQNVSAGGFRADWAVPFIARGVAAEGKSELLAQLIPVACSTSFVELADPYQSVARSVKYALLFFCIVFAAFFVFEATTGKRVHPAQYFLVGVAQTVFYLLLLSIAERIGFGPAFALAAAATVGLISLDASWIFESRVQGWRALSVFSLVYALIYLLLTLEDEALLIGSVASFAATAAIMYFARSIDWYSEGSMARKTASS